MNKKKIKLILFIAILSLGFAIFLYLRFKTYSYETSYNINRFKVVEKYDKNTSYYTFLVTDKNTQYPFQIKSKYNHQHELITNIKTLDKDGITCLKVESDKLKLAPLCSDGTDMLSYNLVNDNSLYKYPNIKDKSTEYKKTTIHNLNNHEFLIYNYRGFDLLNTDFKTINLFKNDVYNLDLYYENSDILIVPNYNDNYYFKKLFVIDKLTGKVKEIMSEEDIAFNSEFLGEFKNKIYLLDKKEKKEYVINLKKETITETDYQVVKDNKLVKVTYQSIINQKLNFVENNEIIQYSIEDENLYKTINDTKIKISANVSKIIRNSNEIVYYLKNENLYSYNDLEGEVLLLSNFEWNFNNTNMIFIIK